MHNLAMQSLSQGLLVGIGAAVGANARYWLGVWITSRYRSDFPWHTFLVNATGAVLLGAVMSLSLAKGWSANWRLLLGVGLAGGYTTFSAFSAEVVTLIEEGRSGHAALYAVASVFVCALACWLGAHGARLAVGR